MDNKEEERLRKSYYNFIDTYSKSIGGKFQLNEFNRKIAESIFESAVASINRKPQIKLVTAQTGTGKSTFTYAMCAALEDCGYTCAFICKTTLECDNAFTRLKALMKIDNPHEKFEEERGRFKRLVVYSGNHSQEAIESDSKKKESILGDTAIFTPSGAFYKSDIQTSKVLVVTHQRLLNYLKQGDNKIIKFNGNERDVVFIDEKLDFVGTYKIRPSDLKKFAEIVKNIDNRVYILLMQVFKRMENVEQSLSLTRKYVTDIIIKQDEYKQYLGYQKDIQMGILNLPMAKEVEKSDSFRLFNRISEFFKSCNQSYILYSRQYTEFLYYDNIYDDFKGYTILDATSDIEGVLPLLSQNDGTYEFDIPKVDYKNLNILYLQTPYELKGQSLKERLISNPKATLEKYKNYIETEIKNNCSKTDKVLIVTFSDIAKYIDEYSDGSKYDPEKVYYVNSIPYQIIYWGNFIGSNKYRNCNKVFLFSEFILPQVVYIALNAGWRQQEISDLYLSKQSGSELTGEVKDLRENNLAMWFKQLAARGTVREITPDPKNKQIGVASPMTLYTDWNLLRLCSIKNRVFPNSPEISITEEELNLHDDNDYKESLMNFLFNAKNTKVSYEAIENHLNIPASNISKPIKAAAEFLKAFNWKKEKSSNHPEVKTEKRYVLVKNS